MELQAAKEKINDFEQARKRRIYDENGEEVEGYRRIVNTENENKIYAITSQEYTILQHREFFPKVFEAVEKLEIQTRRVNVNDDGGRVFIEFVFDEQFEVGDEEILMGIRSGNSFDRSCRAYAGAYGFRQVCSNGMMGKALFGRQAHMHIGMISAQKIVAGIRETLPKAQKKLQSAYRESTRERLSTKETKDLMEQLRIAKKTRKSAINKLPTSAPTRWELYNAVTEVIEESRNDITEQTREYKHRKANEILQ